MYIKEFFCFPAQIAHLPIGKEIPRKMIFINIIHHIGKGSKKKINGLVY